MNNEPLAPGISRRYTEASKEKRTLAATILNANTIQLSFVIPDHNGPYAGLMHRTELSKNEAIRIADASNDLNEVGELAYGLRGGFWIYENKTLTIIAR